MTAQRPDETPLLTHAARIFDLTLIGAVLMRLNWLTVRDMWREWRRA